MMRLAAAILMAVLVAFPLSVLFGPPVTWLAVSALVVGGAGALALSVALVTAGAALTLVAYTLALVLVQSAVDPLPAIAFGATLVLLLALVHFAGHLRGAAVAIPVIASQIGRWLVVVTIGAVAAVVLSAGGTALSGALRGAALPVVVVAGALGALLTAVGVIALVTTRGTD